MITVSVRKQGGAAIMTIPVEVMKRLDVKTGSILRLDVTDGAFTARHACPTPRKRYTLEELLRGVTPEGMAELNADTEWAREGEAVGRELT